MVCCGWKGYVAGYISSPLSGEDWLVRAKIHSTQTNPLYRRREAQVVWGRARAGKKTWGMVSKGFKGLFFQRRDKVIMKNSIVDGMD
jgi:hypothetical protein